MHAEEKSYKCDQCDFQTIWPNSLQCHMKTHDDSAEEFQCEQCDFKTKWRSHLKRHKKTFHDVNNSNQEIVKQEFNCETCDVIFKTQKHFETQLKTQDKYYVVGPLQAFVLPSQLRRRSASQRKHAPGCLERFAYGKIVFSCIVLTRNVNLLG